MTVARKQRWRRLIAPAVIALALAGCQQRLGGLAPLSIGGDKGTSAGGAVMVNPGDSLYLISRRYDVPLRDLIEINRLSPPYNIEPGQRLALPAARQYIVQPGDTLYGVSRMFSVDVSELTRLNNLTPPYAIRSGQPLRLPSPASGYGGDGPSQLAAVPRPKIERSDSASSPAAAPVPSSAGAPFNPAAPSVVYQPGQEPKSLRPAVGAAPAPSPSPAAPSLAAPPPAETPSLALKPGKKPTLEAPPADARPFDAAAAPPPAEAPSVEQPPAREPVGKDKPRDVAAAPSSVKPGPVAAATVAPPPPADAEPPPRAAGRFLTPVKGSVISGFGPKPGGQHNDGVNIAASKGTPVVAADNGVVAYAGNELRGFGNLLLVRHADGWVTAYAHLDHIDVERGAEVKRGQKIGAVGQSGGVPTPQLHFELRKGSQAVDPKGQM